MVRLSQAHTMLLVQQSFVDAISDLQHKVCGCVPAGDLVKDLFAAKKLYMPDHCLLAGIPMQ